MTFDVGIIKAMIPNIIIEITEVVIPNVINVGEISLT
jgi:hypothetical protein